MLISTRLRYWSALKNHRKIVSRKYTSDEIREVNREIGLAIGNMGLPMFRRDRKFWCNKTRSAECSKRVGTMINNPKRRRKA